MIKWQKGDDFFESKHAFQTFGIDKVNDDENGNPHHHGNAIEVYCGEETRDAIVYFLNKREVIISG